MPNLLKEWDKSHLRGVLGLGFVFHLMKNWRNILTLITKHSNNCKGVITFQSFENWCKYQAITH